MYIFILVPPLVHPVTHLLVPSSCGNHWETIERMYLGGLRLMMEMTWLEMVAEYSSSVYLDSLSMLRLAYV